MKGSYYANPLVDVPDVSDELRTAHPECVTLPQLSGTNETSSRYYSGNLWPRDIPEMDDFAATFKAYVTPTQLIEMTKFKLTRVD